MQEVHTASEGGDRAEMRRILRDLDALEALIEEGVLETDVMRIGAEQEMVLVDREYQPASVAEAVLGRIEDGRVVPELARFNVEFNCDPIVMGGSCLRELEAGLRDLFAVARAAAEAEGVRPLIAGICPTVDLEHLSRDNIMPRERYYALDDALRRLRGTDFELRIQGADELIVRHPTVMLESVNTSFQVHFQTTPAEFPAVYNTALAVAAPVIASAVNSPILFGKRLWRETRVAIFQQVVDTRGDGSGRRDMVGRVRFGEKWVEKSILEVFRADVSRFRQLVAGDLTKDEDPAEALRAGRAPKLTALAAFNSAVYRWMRACYGVTDGKPHVRVECRILPAGPTIEDEVANAAFWIGLMAEGPTAWPGLTERLDVRDARANFVRAAREGLGAQMVWLDGQTERIRELVLEEFLPTSRRGLERIGVDAADIDRTLGLIEARVVSGRTGSAWLLDSVARMRGRGKRGQRLVCLTRAMVENQEGGAPVHLWAPAELSEDATPRIAFARVGQCMTTDLFTVGEDECIDLVASIMDWEHIRHIPVENDRHELVGLVSYRNLLHLFAKRGKSGEEIAVSEIMVRDVVTVTPDTPTLEAIALMDRHRVSCLPVVEDGRLVGMLSERDYTSLTRRLLERALREEEEGS